MRETNENEIYKETTMQKCNLVGLRAECLSQGEAHNNAHAHNALIHRKG